MGEKEMLELINMRLYEMDTNGKITHEKIKGYKFMDKCGLYLDDRHFLIINKDNHYIKSFLRILNLNNKTWGTYDYTVLSYKTSRLSSYFPPSDPDTKELWTISHYRDYDDLSKCSNAFKDNVETYEKYIKNVG